MNKQISILSTTIIFLFSQITLGNQYVSDSAKLVDHVVYNFEAFKVGQKNFGESSYSKDDNDNFQKAKNSDLSKIKIVTKENFIVLESAGLTAVLEFKDNKITLNGLELKLNSKISISQSLKNWAITYSKSKKVSKSEFMFKMFMHESQAMDAVTYAAIATSASGSIEAFGTNLAMGYALETAAAAGTATGISGAAGAATAISGAAAAATLGVVIVVLVAGAGALYCESQIGYGLPTSLNQQRLNCYSKPLSWVGLNPRENFYAQQITCKRNIVFTKLQNKIGKNAEFVFVMDKDQLQSVNTKEKLQNGIDPFLVKSNLKTDTQKKDFERFKTDAAYYLSICKSPEKLAAFNKNVAASASERAIYTDQPKANGGTAQ